MRGSLSAASHQLSHCRIDLSFMLVSSCTSKLKSLLQGLIVTRLLWSMVMTASADALDAFLWLFNAPQSR